MPLWSHLKIRNVLAAAVIAIAALPVTPSWSVAAPKEKFTVDLAGEPSSLDPQRNWNPDSYDVYRNIFDNLVTRDDDGKIAPQVAISWKQLSPTEMRFSLRQDIKFQDGTPLTADDVVFSVKRIIDRKFASPQLSQFNQITDAKATDDHTVVLTTAVPYPVLLAQLVKLSIVPKHVVEKVGNEAFNLHPIGSGPYKFVSWKRGVSVTLERNDSYWGKKGPFKTVVFRVVPESSTRVADLEAGTADLVVSLDSDQAAALKSATSAQPLSVLSERLSFLSFNTRKPPLNDKRVRQAIAYGIDREGIVQGILSGQGKVVNQIVAPVSFGWSKNIMPFTYDPAKAKALLAEVGKPAKTPLELATAPVFDQRVVQALQQMLTQIGLNVKIQMSDISTYLKVAQGPKDTQPMLSFLRWSCACQDADGIMYPLLDSQSSWSRYDNKQVDDLLDTGRSTLDKQKRLDAYEKVSKIVRDDVPLLPLYEDATIYGASKSLEWKPTANESLFLNRMSWKGDH